MADYQVKVSADVKDANRDLTDLGNTADKATRARKIQIEFPNYEDLTKNVRQVSNDLETAANNIKKFYSVASKIPGSPIRAITDGVKGFADKGVTAVKITKELSDAGNVLNESFGLAGKAADTLLGKLTRIGLTMIVFKEGINAVQSAFASLFQETIGREIKFRETILKTQATLASSNKVFENGREITDPYKKILALNGQIRERIDSIRERSIALAGVTSGEVVEVFGLVASQIGQIGGGLKEAEDLAINFAAALGTFGIPLYQARQEIGSILRGDITNDSILAKSLNIRNEDIAKAKTQVGGVVKFLEERLAASVAGQRIAAEGFAGVVSNIRDISELINQQFGKGLLDPLLEGLTQVFNYLFSIRKELFGIAELAGRTIGNTISAVVGTVTPKTAVKAKGPEISTKGFEAIQSTIKKVEVAIRSAIDMVSSQLATVVDRTAMAFGAIAKGLTDLGMGLLSLKLENLKAMIGVLEGVSPAILAATKALSGMLSVWGEMMKLPLVQELSQISAGMRVLQMTGIAGAIKLSAQLYFGLKNLGGVVEFVQTQFQRLRAIIGTLIVAFGTLIATTAKGSLALATAWKPADKGLQALREEMISSAKASAEMGNNLQRTGDALGGLGRNFEKAGGGVRKLILGFIGFNAALFAINAALSIVMERWSSWKEAQDDIASTKRAEEALRRLRTTYKDVGDSSTEAQKRAKQFEEGLVNAQYDKALDNLEKVRKKLEDISAIGQKNPFQNFLDKLLFDLNPANVGYKFQSLVQDPIGLDPKNKSALALALKDNANKEKQYKADLAKWGIEVNAQAARRNIGIEQINRANLEKEIKELRRQTENEIFQLRQSLASKEVEAFRAAGELRIFQMEQANKKMIEGEEGASRSALEALNTYLTTKEQGELDIESSKQEMAIELAGIEKQIADYRYETEKKIAEIRKKSDQYTQNVAKYQNEMALATAQAATAAAETPKGATSPTGPSVNGVANMLPATRGGPNFNEGVGWSERRGRNHNGQDLGLDVGDPIHARRAGTVQSIIPQFGKVGKAIVIKYDDGTKGTYGHVNPLSNVTPGTSIAAGQQIATVTPDVNPRTKENNSHLHYELRNQFGLLLDPLRAIQASLKVPKGQVVKGQAETATPDRNRFPQGMTGSARSSTNQTPPAAAAAEPAKPVETPVPPTAPNFDAEGADAIQRYSDLSRSIASALQRIRALREALTEAKTAAAFNEIAKALFPEAQFEQYRDAIETSNVSLKALGKTADQTYDPERLQIYIDKEAKLNILDREIAETTAKAKEKLSAEELKKLEADIAERRKKSVADLETEVKLREEALDLSKKEAAVRDLRALRSEIPFQIQQAGIDAARTNSLVYKDAGQDPVRARMLDAEIQIAQKRIELEKNRTKSSQEVQQELQKFAAETRAAAQVLGEMDKAVQEFTKKISRIKEASGAVSQGFQDFTKSIIMGGDVTEALDSMLVNVASKFVDIGLEYAFEPVKKAFEDIFMKSSKVEDPMEALIGQNNTALDTTATVIKSELIPALNGLTQALTSPQAVTAGTPTPAGAQSIPVEPFSPLVEGLAFPTLDPAMFAAFEAGLSDATSGLTSWTTDLVNTQSSFGEIGLSTTALTQTVGTAAASFQQAPSFMQRMGGAIQGFTGVLASVGAGIAGAQQMGKGGTYNTLMGLAGIFSGIAGVAGAFTPMGGLGGLFRAKGGPVSANRPYIVGEQGPELFMPSSNGEIVPNNDLFSKSRSALAQSRERTAQMNETKAMADASKQTRPISVSYESSVINNVEYVTADQMRAATKQAAERGRALAYQGLSQSTRVRKRLGL